MPFVAWTLSVPMALHSADLSLSEHHVIRWLPLRVFCLSSSQLTKVLIRKSAIRARSGASTLKDQYLGELPGIEKETERVPEHQITLNTICQHLTSTLQGSKRSNTIGRDLPKCQEESNFENLVFE